ncbi:hypothetical protein [Thalassospira povalilytica]|uniref:hypothetical protein n=1 Tax=Thalassospira povalilytica TaxID=732237 RepID=UPI003AA9D0F3
MVDEFSPKEWFTRNLTAILAFSGFVLILIANTAFEDPESKFAEIAGSIGQATLAGGVFNALVKSNTFSEIFSEILRKIIYAEDNLKSRKDIENIWEKVTKAYMSWKFDEITPHILQDIKNRTISNQNYYYKETRRIVKIRWENEETKESISEDETVKTTIIPHSKNEKISIKFEHNPDNTEEDEKPYIKVESLCIDEIPSFKLEDHLKTQKNRTIYDIELTGKPKYTLTRKTKKIRPINAEPDSRYLFRTFVQNWHLHVEVASKDLAVFYKAIGQTSSHEDNFLGEKGDHNKATIDSPINISGKSILHPWSGYMLVRQKL